MNDRSVDRSIDINELAKALALAQSKIAYASKDSLNPHFNRSYADLASIWEACRGPLTENGLSVVQQPMNGENGQVGVRTTLLHLSGQWMESVVYATPERPGPQALGSCITYLRRYSLAAVAGVAPDDDDGEAAERERPGRLVTAQKQGLNKEAAPAVGKERLGPQKASPYSSGTKPQTSEKPNPSSGPNLQVVSETQTPGGSGQETKNYLKATDVPPLRNAGLATKDQLARIHILKKEIGLADWVNGIEHYEWDPKQWPLYRQKIGAYYNIQGDRCRHANDLQEHQAANLIKAMEANSTRNGNRSAQMLRQIAAAVPEAREYINIDDIFDKAFPTSAGEETAWLLPFGFESRADIPTELHHDFIILLQAFKLGGDKWENARDKFLERQGNAGL